MHYYYLSLFLYIFFWKGSMAVQAQNYVQAYPQSGDGIFVFLRRYGLERHSCNFDLFYELNALNKNSSLQLNKKYKLPIEVYTYNQKSIRSTANIQDWHAAKQVQRYNYRLQTLHLKKEDFKKGKRQLWVPHHIKQCPTDLRTFLPKEKSYAIFGKKHANISLKSEKLVGAVYYIIAGHGGPDPGAMAKYKDNNICEDEYAYDIALRLAKNLLEQGAIVHVVISDPNDGIRDTEILACDKDEICYPNQTIPFTQKERLQQRSDAINNLYDEYYKAGIDYQCLIEIHIDSRPVKQRIDLFFYHQPDDILSKQLNQDLYNIFKEKYKIHRKKGEYYGSVSARDLHMLRESKPMSAFIEVANMQNIEDQKRIVIPSNRQAIADWLSEGLLEDY